jgi:hypothetical protein
MRIVQLMIVVGAAGMATSAAGAAPDAKPGLWQWTVTRQMEGAPVSPAADPSKLTPERRARIEQMMSVRGATAPTTAELRYCVTAEAARRWDTFSREDGDEAKCERTVQEETPRALKASLACAGGVKGSVAFTSAGPERFRGTITWIRQEQGGPRTTTIDVDSRWLSPDCGTVKPGAPQRVKG